MTSLDEHYMSLPEGTRTPDDTTPGSHRADPPWYRQPSLYGDVARSTFLGLSVVAAWVALALGVFAK